MPGKPFQSALIPHFELIKELRSKRKGWQEIADHLKMLGVTRDRGSVCAFFKRHRRRPAPMGMESEIKAPSSRPLLSPKPHHELPEWTEPLPPASEFGPDPLTTSVKKKWGIFPAT
jgi:hypothetical protein